MQETVVERSQQDLLVKELIQGEILDEVFQKLRSIETLSDPSENLELLKELFNEIQRDYDTSFHIDLIPIEEMIELPDGSYYTTICEQCGLRLTMHGDIILLRPFDGQVADVSVKTHPYLVNVMPVIFSSSKKYRR